MTVLFEHIVPSGVENERFLEYVIENIPTVLSRNSAKKAIKKGALLLDDGIVESGRYVHSGQAITHIQHNETSGKIFEKKLEVVFEDEYIAVINKPAGISVSGNYFRTIQNALPFNLNPSNKSDAILPKPVHRIDNQTSGLLIIAKTQQAAINLGQQFVNKSVSKTYIAIVIGKIESVGIIETSIEGKKAISKFELIETVKSIKYKYLSLVKLMPITGRTHQLRIHMSKMEHPILGDKLYTKPELIFKGKGLFLSSISVKFVHPVSETEQNIQIITPNKFSALLKREQQRWDNLGNQ